MTQRRHPRSRRHRRPRRSSTGRPSPRPEEPAADPSSQEPYRAVCEEDLVAMVPLVLGFHPHESVVLMTFGATSFHARVDLPGADAMLGGADLDVAELLLQACRTNGADTAALVIYTADPVRARRQGECAVAALHGAGLRVVDVLRVHDGHWFEPLHDRGDDGPDGPDGEADPGTPFDLRDHRFTARHVFEGHAVRRDRDELRDDLLGGDDDERERMLDAIAFHAPLLRPGGDPAHVAREARWVRERVRRAVRSGAPLTTAEAARMLTCLVRADVRDAAWVDLRRENAAAHVPVWRDLARRSPVETLPSACALLALASYLSGDGAAAWVAIDHAVDVAGEAGRSHSLLGLVADALLGALPPSHWPVPDAGSLPLLR